MSENIRGNRTITGAYGELWLDNEKVAELKSVEAKITVFKVYTRGKRILENWIKGKDVRSRIVTSIKDPDSLKGQEERVSIDNVWFDSIELAKFTRGEIVEEEIPFGFTPSDVKYENVIK